jgi:hypothetical protein
VNDQDAWIAQRPQAPRSPIQPSVPLLRYWAPVASSEPGGSATQHELAWLQTRWRYWRRTSMSLDVIFAYVVGVLAALAVIGAWRSRWCGEWCAIRRTLAAHRHQTPNESFWRDHAALTIPERRP